MYQTKGTKKSVQKKQLIKKLHNQIVNPSSLDLGDEKQFGTYPIRKKNDENLRKTSQTDPKRLNNGDNYNKNKAIFRLKVAKIEYLERFPSAGGPFQKLIVVDGQFGHRI